MRNWKPILAAALTLIASGSIWALADDLSGAKVPLIQADYTSASGTVEFCSATGHPSALHVDGKGVGLKDLSISQNNVTGTVSFDLNTLDTGISMRNEHMKEKYLEVTK